MVAYIAMPGSENGSCAGACSHYDCIMTRKVAATACDFCGQPIGYDRDFEDLSGASYLPGEVLAHADCLDAFTEEGPDWEGQEAAEAAFYVAMAEDGLRAAEAWERDRMDAYGGTYRLGERLPDVPRGRGEW